MSRLPGPLAAQAILTALAQCAGAAGARNAPRDTYNYVIGTQTIGASYLSPFPFGITPDVLNSLHLEGIGFGALEKEQDRKARLFREKVEEIEMESWRQAGCPEGGPVQFRAVACDQLKRALEGEGVD